MIKNDPLEVKVKAEAIEDFFEGAILTQFLGFLLEFIILNLNRKKAVVSYLFSYLVQPLASLVVTTVERHNILFLKMGPGG